MPSKKEDTIMRDMAQLEAAVNYVNEIVARLREKLQPVSTGGSKKTKGLSSIQRASLTVDRRKKLLKRA